MDLLMIFVMLLKLLSQFERGIAGRIDCSFRRSRANSPASKYNQNIFHSMMFGFINRQRISKRSIQENENITYRRDGE